MSDDIRTNDSAAHAPEEVRRWAQRIVEAQGCPAILARETSGYHLYIPCPECLDTHGRRELDDPKYAINLSVLAGLGEYRDETEGEAWRPNLFEDREELRKKKEFGAGVCMRTRSARKPHLVPLQDILAMGTITERHPDIQTRADMRGGAGSDDVEEMWEEDPVSGKKCPPPPGEVVPLGSLPPKHPAIQYLTGRGYDIAALEDQFRMTFCVKEYTCGEKNIFYRKMPGGWKDSPQHRIVFYALVDGVPLSWQARVIEKQSDDELNKYMLHPYAGGYYRGKDTASILRSFKKSFKLGSEGDKVQMVWDEGRGGHWLHVWSHTHTRSNPKAPWMPMPPYDELNETGTMKFRPSKYRTAKYSHRQLMGWDAAQKRAARDVEELRWCVLCEGPLDGARIGAGGLPVTGSSISIENAAKVVSNYHIVFMAFDDDVAGREATAKISSILQSSHHKASIMLSLTPLNLPQGKDPGDLTPDEYLKIFKQALNRVRRTL
jgi:hypothetical protein